MESDFRRILNFGHTFGHALEAATYFEYFTHGEAVMHGMRFAVALSTDYFKIQLQRFNNLLKCIDLMAINPVPNLESAKVLKFMLKDKKRIKNKINFILLSDLGKPEISDDIPIELIESHITNYLNDNA